MKNEWILFETADKDNVPVNNDIVWLNYLRDMSRR